MLYRQRTQEICSINKAQRSATARLLQDQYILELARTRNDASAMKNKGAGRDNGAKYDSRIIATQAEPIGCGAVES
jgi:hypothetical protein